MSLPLRDLPDYPTIQQIQSALWQAETLRGAAVMVGAGFSRLATRASEDMPLPPLWGDFNREMTARLGYPAGAQMDALKLAQEYDTALGRSALDALIRSLVRDAELAPGRSHERLMGLPWADVLTTNWDTLLERTAIDPDGPQYQVVRTVDDIAHTRSPRIIKLHGSLPSQTPFIFTEEDFRSYTHRFAPFVNTAQQALLENELCLIGFSGDDPNFLRWAGWVRDQLGASARRIRLVGVLDLSPSKRRMFEQQNISVVDLAPLVAHLDRGRQHAAAYDLFLNSLWEAKPRAPHVWSRSNGERSGSESASNEDIESLARDWRSDRLAYPGWIVPPPSERIRVRMDTDQDWRALRFAFSSAADEKSVGSLLREAIWRHDVTLWPLDPLLEEVARTFFGSSSRGGLPQSDQAEMLGVLAAEARHRRDWNAFDRWIALLDAVADEEAVARAAYERALRGRDELDFAQVAKQVDAIQGRDPIWALRRANVLIELGEPIRAARILKAARAEIRERRRSDPRSIWLLSRQAWTHWLWRSARYELHRLVDEADDLTTDWDWPILYRAAQADPWDEMQGADHRISEEATRALKDRSDDRRSQFDPGVYSPSQRGMRFTNRSVVASVDELCRLADRIGLPSSMGSSHVIGDRVAQALTSDQDTGEARTWLAARSLRSGADGLINERFGRVAISRLPLDLVRSLAAGVSRAIEYGLPRMERRGADDTNGWQSDWLNRLVRWTELLSRLVVRLPADEARAVWDFAIKLAHDSRWSHWWLYEPLAHLLSRALEAMPRSQQVELGLDALQLPLPREHGTRGQERNWPELVELLQAAAFKRPADDNAWANRVANLIHIARKDDGLDRTRAILRLLVLHGVGSLTASEQRDFAQAIWSQRAEDGSPGNLQLLDHVPLRCPEPEPGLAEGVFRATVYERIAKGDLRLDDLISARQAALTMEGLAYRPDRDQGLQMARALLAWTSRVRADEPDLFADLSYTENQIAAAIGPALAHVVLPVFEPGDLGESYETAWRAALLDPARPSVLVTAVEAIRLWPAQTDFAISRVRKALASGEQSFVLHGLEAVEAFRRAAALRQMAFPKILADDVVTSCAVRREPGLSWSLQCATALLKNGLLSKDDQDRLISGLEFLQVETAYGNWNANDPRTPSLGLVRRECVRLADGLMKQGRESEVLEAWLSVSGDDPVPEVRFALDGVDDPTPGD